MGITRKSFISKSFLGFTSIYFGSFYNSVCEPHLAQIIKPKRIPTNATLGLVAPASPIYNSSDYDNMINELTNMGYKLELGQHHKDRKGYLAGEDEDRVSDLHSMFSNNEIDAIICTRGGYGSNRILDLIDFELIKRNPKPFIGFSDITSLHMAIYKKTGLITFHGPVGKSYWNDFTINAWNSILHDAETPIFKIPDSETDDFVINSGQATGKLLGGNLTVLTSLIGSDYLPDFKDSILFLEDVGEDIYRVDRMMSQLSLSGILDEINGLIFGKCTECTANSNSLSLEEVLNHYLNPLEIPAFYGAMISHEEQNLTIPVGVLASINADEKSIQLLEPGVL